MTNDDINKIVTALQPAIRECVMAELPAVVNEMFYRFYGDRSKMQAEARAAITQAVKEAVDEGVRVTLNVGSITDSL